AEPLELGEQIVLRGGGGRCRRGLGVLRGSLLGRRLEARLLLRGLRLLRLPRLLRPGVLPARDGTRGRLGRARDDRGPGGGADEAGTADATDGHVVLLVLRSSAGWCRLWLVPPRAAGRARAQSSTSARSATSLTTSAGMRSLSRTTPSDALVAAITPRAHVCSTTRTRADVPGVRPAATSSRSSSPARPAPVSSTSVISSSSPRSLTSTTSTSPSSERRTTARSSSVTVPS